MSVSVVKTGLRFSLCAMFVAAACSDTDLTTLSGNPATRTLPSDGGLAGDIGAAFDTLVSDARSEVTLRRSAGRSTSVAKPAEPAAGLEVPGRLAGPAPSPIEDVVPYDVAGNGVRPATFSPLDWPMTEALDPALAARQAIVDPDGAHHPDTGRRAAADPAGSFEVLSLRTETSRILQLADGTRMYVAFPAAAFAEDRAGALRSNLVRFEQRGDEVTLRTDAGAAGVLPADIADGLSFTTRSGAPPITALQGLEIVAYTPSGPVALPTPTGAVHAHGAFATYWDEQVDAGVRLDGLHDGFEWSATLGARWATAVPPQATRVALSHLMELPKDAHLVFSGRATSGVTTCDPVRVVADDGTELLTLGGVRVWDAAAARDGSALSGCPELVTQRFELDGRVLTATVSIDAMWLAAAEFPVVVDPEITWTSTSANAIFGTVYASQIYANAPFIGNMEWGDHDARRGFAAWPLNNFPSDGWALGTDREVTVLGHLQPNTTSFQGSAYASLVEIRFLNYFQDSQYRPATYAAGSAARGTDLYSAFSSAAWHTESIGGSPPLPATWTTQCSGSTCTDGVVLAESEPNDTYATASAALLGTQGGPGVCANTCATASNGVCQDGGPGYKQTGCSFGTDCADCGTRQPLDLYFQGNLGSNDRDNFGVEMSYSPAIRVWVETVDGSPCTIDGVLELRIADEVLVRADGVCPTLNTCSMNPSWSCSLMAPGAYGVSFRGYAPFNTGNYRVHVEVDRNPQSFSGLYKARWIVDTSFGDNPVNVLAANQNQPYINEMWKNTSRGTVGSYYTAGNQWYGVNRRSDATTYPRFVIRYAQPVLVAPGDFTWTSRAHDEIRWEWNHATNAQWYELVSGSGSVIASNLYRYFEVTPGVYRYFVDEQALTENTCYVRSVRGDNEIGEGPAAPNDQVATLARTPVVPSAPIATDGDFTVSTSLMNATLNFSYAMPSLSVATGCDLSTNESRYEARLVSCTDGTILAGTTVSSTSTTVNVTSPASCAHVEVRYVNMDNVPTSWIRTAFQVSFSAGLAVPGNWSVIGRGVQSIHWGWVDTSSSETQFVVADQAGVTRQTVASTTGVATGASYSWDETSTTAPDGNVSRTRRVRARNGAGENGPNSADLTAYTLPRQAKFSSGTNYDWADTDAIVYDLYPENGAYTAQIVIAAQPNNALAGCSGATLTRCELIGGVTASCVTVSAGTQGDAAADGSCLTPVATGTFGGRGYGDQYDNGEVVSGDGLFAGRSEGVVYDTGLQFGKAYRYTLQYVNADDFGGASMTFDMPVGCCFDPANAPSYHGAVGSCAGVCSAAVQGLFLACEPPVGYGSDANCDGLDNDCDGTPDDVSTAWYRDIDGDGFGAPSSVVNSCASPGAGWTTTGGDCDDTTPSTSPASLDLCDGVDNDCNPASNDGSSDGALGRLCATGVPGACAGGAATCGVPGSSTNTFPDTAALAGWTITAATNSWLTGTTGWNVRGNYNHDTRYISAPWAINSFNAEIEVTAADDDYLGFIFDVQSANTYAYVYIYLGNTSAAGDERVFIGRSNNGTLTHTVTYTGLSAAYNQRLRLLVQSHNGTISAWVQNVTTGTALLSVGSGSIGISSQGRVGLGSHSISSAWVHRFSVQGATLSCETIVEPGEQPETCNGLDDDCDGTSDDGFGVGNTCDGSDTDACTDGIVVCDATGIGTECRDRSPYFIWNFEETSGTTAYDDSGSGRNLTLNTGSSFTTTAKFGSGALALNGSTGYASAAVDLSETEFTIGAWFRTSATAGGILSVTNGPTTSASTHDRYLYLQNGKIGYRVLSGANSRCQNVGPLVNDGNWHHAVMTCRQGVACRLYLDGAQVCETTVAASTYSYNTSQTHLLVGYSAVGGGRLNGSVDHVAAYPYQLTATEIAAIYANGTFTPDGGANREVCDAVDNDCDGNQPAGASTYYRDADRDGYGNPANSATFCPVDAAVLAGDWVTNNTDCNDAAFSINPGAPELVGNEIDNDCDGTEICYVDQDRDQARSYGTVESLDLLCSVASGEARSSRPVDCDDEDQTIFPGALELCDGLDNDCDGLIDEGFASAVEDIVQPGSDCSTGPSLPATSRLQTIFDARGELLSAVEDAGITPETYVPAQDLTFHFVAEGAGYENVFGWYNAGTDVSNPANRFPIFACNEEPGSSMVRTVNIATDPRYLGGTIGFFILTPQGRTNNCATNTDYGYAYFTELALNTGDLACTDNPFLHYLVYKSTAYHSTYYFGFEDLYRGGDNDFEDVLVMVEGLVGENEWYRDADLDGFGNANDWTVSCTQPFGYVDNSEDCVDLDSGTHPNATEFCDLVDNNCSGGVVDEGVDADGDGYTHCYDCDDTDPTRNITDVDDDGYDTCGSVIANGNALLQYLNAGVIGDAFVRATGENFGTDVALAVGNSSGVEASRTAIAFDLASVPADAAVVRAEAYLYAYTRYDANAGSVTPVDRNVGVHPILRPWTEDAITAAVTGTLDGAVWGAPRLALDDADAGAIAADNALIQASETVFPVGWVAFDITGEVQAWLAGSPNYGILLAADNETTEGFDVRFFSSEYGNPALRPYLRITWTGTPELVDCEDDNEDVNPGADEVCDEIDNNCDTYVDDAEPGLPDDDGDGYSVCDCDDTDPYTFVGAAEVCDYRDNDCDPTTSVDDAFSVGTACDGADADACSDGVVICSNDLTTAVCSNGATAIYRFEEEAATLAYDWSGSGVSGVLHGPATFTTTARYGNRAVDFDGATASAVRIANASASGLEFTAAAWVRREAAGSRFVFARTADTGDNGLSFGIDGALWFAQRNYSDGALAISANTWTHVAVTFDRRTLRVYLDGVLRKSTTISSAFQPASWASDVWFGQELDANDGGLQTSQAFDGQMDDVVWFNHAVSASGVSDLMNGNVALHLNAEICDGADNDCSGAADELFTVGTTCDGADADACSDGVEICSANGLATMCGDGAGGLFDFNGTGAGVGFDRSGNGRIAQLVSGAAQGSIAGRTGVGLLGDASSAVRVPGLVAQAPQFSFAAWVYPQGLGGAEVVANIGTQRSETCSFNGFTLFRDGQVGLNCQTVSDASMALAANTWTHVVVTFDGTQIKFYRSGNSTPAFTWDVCAGSPVPNCASDMRALAWTTDLWLGQEQDLLNAGFSAADSFEGMIDDVAWYNYALTGAQAATLASGFPSSDANFEFCDGTDNDCQAGSDDPYAGILGEACTVGVGACQRTGFYVCGADGLAAVCDGVPGDPSPEICDGEDNDCDASTDEDASGANLTESCYSGPSGSEGVGACHAGSRMCVSGSWSACAGEVVPTVETCDGADNDCNGSVDRVAGGTSAFVTQSCYSGPAGTAGEGLCRAGTQICQASGTWGACSGEVLPATETCDGEDNDCDGTDDHFAESCYSGPDGTEGVGACEAGSRLCDDGAWGACAGQTTPAAEICSVDGTEDMNCDGAADDNCVDAVMEILGLVSGDPDTDYTACDLTDGDSTLCTYMTIRLSNLGGVPLPAGTPVEVWRGTTELLSGPFMLPAEVPPGENVEIAYCFNSEFARSNATVRVRADFGDGNVAEDSLASQNIAACGFEICDGYDNDADGLVDERPDACGSTQLCILALGDVYRCVAAASAETACADGACASSECATAAECEDGEFCANGNCVYSGRWTTSEPAPSASVLEPLAGSAGGAGQAGCSAAAPSGRANWALLLVAGVFVTRRRRTR